jgi:serine/threonine protein phosphatase PrpC
VFCRSLQSAVLQMAEGSLLTHYESLTLHHFYPSSYPASGAGGRDTEPEVGGHALGVGDVALVAATDGLWDVLGVEDTARIVRRAGTAQAAADALVEAALAADTHDNVTAVVVYLADLAPASSGGRS